MSDDVPNNRIKVTNPNKRPVVIQSRNVALKENEVTDVDRNEFDVRLLLKQKKLKQVYG